MPEKDLIELKGITWDHSRGLLPVVATAQRYGELNPGVKINWEKRSLQEFADKPLSGLAADYDLLVIDHPWIGFAAAHDLLLPLDEYLPEAFLKDQADNSVGRSFESYSYNGHQWALAIDVATPAASSRPDLMERSGFPLPETFDDLLALADEGVVIFPGIPIDTLMNFYMFCSAYGADPFALTDDNRAVPRDTDRPAQEVVSRETGIRALQAFRRLASRVDRSCFDRNPIQVYETMTSGDRFAYCPFAYGYVNYARQGYARRPLQFHDLVSMDGTGQAAGALKSTLGGTGLAISRACKQADTAVRYAEYVAGAECQRTIYFESGGQPGHRAAWTDEHTNLNSAGFFRETLPALDRAFLRPRYNGHLHFQDQAGDLVRDYLIQGGDEEKLLNELNRLYTGTLSSENLNA